MLVQLSDPHVVAPLDPGHLKGVDTAAALFRALACVERLAPRPDAAVITGDLVNLGIEAEYRALRDVISSARAPIFLLPGNHDDRAALRAAFPDHAYLHGPEPFIQYVIERPDYHLIGVDTLVQGGHDGELDRERLAWLEVALTRTAGRPVIVAMHHPPFKTGLVSFDQLAFTGAADFEALIARFSHVERIICGHNHRALQRRFGGTIISVCPSTAFSYELALEPGRGFRPSSEPPGFQIHLWHQGALITHTHLLPPTDPNGVGPGRAR